MPFIVNGQVVPEQLIQEERARIGADPQWQSNFDERERAERLRAAAECSAADRVLIEQIAARDPRPIDPAQLEAEIDRLKTEAGCRAAFDDAAVRQFLDRQMRVQRLTSELAAGAVPPTPEAIESFFHMHRQNFHRPEYFHAAHIVKHVNAGEDPAPARAAIEDALAELERGDAFSEVAARHSDCKDNAGDLGEFRAGTMVDEFEQALRCLEPGERTGIFSTSFGFHIAELRAKAPAGVARFEDVREDIERVLAFSAQHEAYARALAELRSQADIRWVPDARAAAS
jgi:parvulin-like peptidyl-prolyl isomerase